MIKKKRTNTQNTVEYLELLLSILGFNFFYGNKKFISFLKKEFIEKRIKIYIVSWRLKKKLRELCKISSLFFIWSLDSIPAKKIFSKFKIEEIIK